jgi:transposase InsO family protein
MEDPPPKPSTSIYAQRQAVLRQHLAPKQYTFAAACARLGVVQSMGAVGTNVDNAAAEAFNASLKREALQG